jgi:hypothetical protein
MPYLIGLLLAPAVCLFARRTGLSTDGGFYPTVLIVVASYYVLFATMAGSHRAILAEVLVMGVFVAVAVAGFNGRPWLVVAGLAGHGVFDVFHGRLRLASSMPSWWPAFCMAIDVGLAACVAFLLLRCRPASR